MLLSFYVPTAARAAAAVAAGMAPEHCAEQVRVVRESAGFTVQVTGSFEACEAAAAAAENEE